MAAKGTPVKAKPEAKPEARPEPEELSKKRKEKTKSPPKKKSSKGKKVEERPKHVRYAVEGEPHRTMPTGAEVDPTMCPMRVHTPGSGTDTACAVWDMEVAIPGRVGENLGTLRVDGPAVALDSNARRPCPCSEVPHSLSFVSSISPNHMPDFRYRVASHQYECMQLAGELRHNLPMPQDPVEGRRSSSGGTAIWYTAFRRRAQCLPPTEERLVRQCHYHP